MKTFLLWFASSLGLALFLTLIRTGPSAELKQFFWVLSVTTLFWMVVLPPMLSKE